ncbi:hypothetical protein SAMN04488107_1437 [Geodermatophilus saharensis]|uniref:Uncharacterized protein n=1 Tax=Geodermatophilus saharensis TaxID=1137994 RepID=A0A239BWE5_9ACTN|nr:hypothetical protein [Geodermatophilus saharensis]SNS11493.1 hypothetical protein SAMN04488107_1437 [Geodermatophilus saharensis]
MTDLRTRPPSTAGRRGGAVAAALANGVLLLLVHVWPGWEVVPFLTDDTTRVLRYVDAALIAGIAVALLQLVRPGGASVPAGTVVTTAFGLAATVRVLQVFPFDLDPGWEVVVRVVLWIGVAGGVVGILVALVALLRLRAARR